MTGLYTVTASAAVSLCMIKSESEDLFLHSFKIQMG